MDDPTRDNAANGGSYDPVATESRPIGGFAFFLSLTLLSPTALTLLALALSYANLDNTPNLGVLVSSSFVGALSAQLLIKRHISVLLHESKHSVVSNLVGNKLNKMHIDEHSGYIEYSYTKETAHLNFLIALAPYILPLFSVISVLLICSLGEMGRWPSITILGLGYGADLLLNLRDVSPVQTDISLIRGGYSLGLAYIVAWNIAILALVLAWTLDGSAGLASLLRDVGTIFLSAHPAAPQNS